MPNDFIPGDTPLQPLTPREAYSPDYWRGCAERMRVKAMLAPDAAARSYRRAAADFERLAVRAAAIQATDDAG